MHRGSSERDVVLVLSDLTRKIDHGREAVLQCAGENAFGYTAEAAERVSGMIEETLALCRRGEKVLQMWSALSAATVPADSPGSSPPAIGALADEVHRAVREFKAVAEAARSSMVQVGWRKHAGPRQHPQGWAELFGRPMVQKSWDQLFSMSNDESAESHVQRIGSPGNTMTPAPSSAALDIWSKRVDNGSFVSSGLRSCAVAASRGGNCSTRLDTSSGIDGAFNRAAEAMAAANARRGALSKGEGRLAASRDMFQGSTLAVAEPATLPEATTRVRHLIGGLRDSTGQVEQLTAASAWSFGRGVDAENGQLKEIEAQALSDAKEARWLLAGMVPSAAMAEMHTELETVIGRFTDVVALAYQTIDQVRSTITNNGKFLTRSVNNDVKGVSADLGQAAETGSTGSIDVHASSSGKYERCPYHGPRDPMGSSTPLAAPQSVSSFARPAGAPLPDEPESEILLRQPLNEQRSSDRDLKTRPPPSQLRTPLCSTAGRSGRLGERGVPPYQPGLQPQPVVTLHPDEAISRSPRSLYHKLHYDESRERILQDAVRINNELIDERGRAIDAISTEVQELGELFVEVAQIVGSHDEPIRQLGRDIDAAEAATAAAAIELEKAAKKDGCVVS